MKIARIFAAGLVTALAVLASSCTKESGTGKVNSVDNAKGMLSVTIPGKQIAARTYATFPDNATENEVSIASMKVFLFNSSDVLVYAVPYSAFESGNTVARFPLSELDPTNTAAEGRIEPYVGQAVTAVFVANWDVPAADYTVGTTTLTDFQKIVTSPAIAATADMKPFIMYGEVAGVTIQPLTSTTPATVIMTRLASRIDITNNIGPDLVIVSAQVKNAATTAPLALDNSFEAADFADLDVLANLGLSTANADPQQNVAGTGAASDDMTRMWSQVYTYPNPNDATATTVEIAYTYRGAPKTATVEFKDETGATIPVERNYRYEIQFTQDVLDMPTIPITQVTPWVAGGEIMEANISDAALVVTAPTSGLVSSTPNTTPATGGTMTIDGLGHTLDFAYTSTSPVSYEITADDDITTGSPWASASNTVVTTYVAATGGYTGKVTFSAERNLEKDGRKAILKIKNSDRTVTYVISQEIDAAGLPTVNVACDANSFIVAPGAAPIVFDMTQVINEARGRIGANDKVGVKFLWTDSPKGMAADAPVASVASYETGLNTLAQVTPGTGEGNVVVAAYNFTTQKIAWSWHIWVTNYNPATTNNTFSSTGTQSVTMPDANSVARGGNIFMDRNMGALNNTPGDLGAGGLLYEFGRKDPFIGKGDWVNNTTENRFMYDAGGTVIPLIKRVNNNAAIPNGGNPNNLDYAVENPNVYIFGQNVSIGYDWYTSVDARGSQNDNLWATVAPASPFTVTKSVYDPCPTGWRVPANGAFTGLTPGATATNYAFPWSPTLFGRYGSASASLPGDLIDTSTANNPTQPGVNNTLGYFPASGNRAAGSGNFNYVSTYGYGWYSTVVGGTSGNGYYLGISATGVSASSSNNRANGFPVRCLQE